MSEKVAGLVLMEEFPALWKLGDLVVDDPVCPTKLYLIKEDICAKKWTACDCGHTHYNITREILYELSGIRFVKVAEREIKIEDEK